MTLKEIHNEYKRINSALAKETKRLIDSACEELLPMLLAIETESDFPSYVFDDFDEKRFHIRYLCRIAIRYCGTFVNTIWISKDETKTARERISLTYISYEDDDEDCFRQGRIYPDDGYFGEKADESIRIINIVYDYKNFIGLLESLLPFFRKTRMKDKYETFFRKYNVSYEESKLITDNYIDYIIDLDDLEREIKEYFKKIGYYVNDYIEIFDTEKFYFIKIPNGLSVRYKGRFHNYIIISNNTELAYIKDPFSERKEYGYNEDIYTRNQGEQELVHRDMLTHNDANEWEVEKVLEDLCFLFED